MDERTTFVLLPDGSRIACAAVGAGPPYVWLPSFSTAALTNEESSSDLVTRLLVERWARDFTVVRYESNALKRALSGETVSTAACVAELQAVVDAYGGRAVVRARGDGCAIAASFAAHHPDEVIALVLFAPFDSGVALNEASRGLVDSLRSLYGANANIGLNAVSDATGLEAENPLLREHAAQILRSDLFVRIVDSIDVTRDLPHVASPTLVIHAVDDSLIPIEFGKNFASLIPGARFKSTEGGHIPRDVAIVNDVSAAIASFLGTGATRGQSGSAGALRTILFTDIVSHTEMMHRLGDERGRSVLREHERITRDLLKEHGGAEVKTMGDGFLASFASVTKAMDCAIALQRAFAAHEGEPLEVRVGLNAGEPIEEDGDLFGSAVIMASRIAAKAAGGEILIPEAIRHLLAGKSYAYADRGETVLKGFEDVVRLYEVRWRPT